MIILFLLKKIISRIVFPIPLVLELLVLGIILKKWRKRLLVIAVILLYFFSCAPFSYMILKPLEGRYDPVSEAVVNREVQWIVVLSAGSRDHKMLTNEDRLDVETLKRLLEGVRLSRLIPAARLVLSGGSYKGETPDALLMQQVALDYGAPKDRIVLEADSWDTADEARFLQKRLGQMPFYLVTSASHMPRAMRIFSRTGMRPLAAPTDFLAVKVGPWDIRDFIPSAAAMLKTEMAFYEYLGLGWNMFLAAFQSMSE